MVTNPSLLKNYLLLVQLISERFMMGVAMLNMFILNFIVSHDTTGDQVNTLMNHKNVSRVKVSMQIVYLLKHSLPSITQSRC